MSSRILEPSGQKLELDVSNDAYSLGEQLLYWEGGGQRPSRGWKWPKTPHWSPGRPVRSCPAYCQALIGRRVVYPVLADVMQSCTPIAHQPNQRRCVKELCFFRKELCYCFGGLTKWPEPSPVSPHPICVCPLWREQRRLHPEGLHLPGLVQHPGVPPKPCCPW